VVIYCSISLFITRFNLINRLRPPFCPRETAPAGPERACRVRGGAGLPRHAAVLELGGEDGARARKARPTLPARSAKGALIRGVCISPQRLGSRGAVNAVRASRRMRTVLPNRASHACRCSNLHERACRRGILRL
jgi:hypothetical protein